MNNLQEQYESYAQRARELADIGHAQGLLGWDQEVNMPPKGALRRARSSGTLAGVRHQMLTAPDLVDLVAALAEADLAGDAAVNVRETKREQDRALRIPKDLVVELSRTQSLAHAAWVEARRTTCCSATTTSPDRRPSAAACWPTSGSTCRPGASTSPSTPSAPAGAPTTCA